MKSTWAILLAGICVGCNRTPPARDSGSGSDSAPAAYPSKSPAPAVAKDCELPKTAADVRACVRDLEFDELKVAGDQQRLMACKNGTCGYGPLATIQPEKGSYEGSLDTGRIIARMFLNRGDAYPKLALAPRDTTYWWVQKRSDSSTGRSIYMRVSGNSLVVREVPLHFGPYRGSAPLQALARWLWMENDEKTQGTCGSGTCQ